MTPLLTLKALVELQEIDNRIRELEKDRQHIPERLKEIEDLFTTKRQELNDDRNLCDEAEMTRRLAEGDLKSEKEKVKKWEARLSEIKNNRDYQALSREIESARKANLGIEDEILRKMQEIEDLKSGIARKEEDLADLEKNLSTERADLEEKLQSINADIAKEEITRTQARERVDARWYRQYDTIRTRRDGVAVVPALDEHCRGCNMGIPPQLYIIVLRGENIETCPHCHRIIYYEKALEGLRANSGNEDGNSADE